MKKSDLVKVESSNIVAVGFENDTLYIEYTGGGGLYAHEPVSTGGLYAHEPVSAGGLYAYDEVNAGSVYAYSAVNKSVYEDLLKAKSKGKFVHANIKNVYKCKKIILEK